MRARRVYAVIGAPMRDARATESPPAPEVLAAREARKLRALGALAAGLVHEINTPAQYIGDNLQFLQSAFAQLARALATVGAADGTAGGDVEYLLHEIPSALAESIEGVAQLSRMVSALKGFALAPVGGVAPVDLNAEVESVITVARNEWKYVADVRCELDAKLPPVPCVAGELKQVILSLLLEAAGAAARRGGGHGTVTVRTRAGDGWVELSVSDAGAGRPDDARVTTFAGAASADPAVAAERPDLVLVRETVVNEHAGALHVEAVRGEGTTVVVRLPAGRAAAEGR